jgi:hypothetical protein
MSWKAIVLDNIMQAIRQKAFPCGRGKADGIDVLGSNIEYRYEQKNCCD